jgi:hypothetical protein
MAQVRYKPEGSGRTKARARLNPECHIVQGLSALNDLSASGGMCVVCSVRTAHFCASANVEDTTRVYLVEWVHYCEECLPWKELMFEQI